MYPLPYTYSGFRYFFYLCKSGVFRWLPNCVCPRIAALPLACTDRTLFAVATLFPSSGRTMAIVFSFRRRVQQKTQAILSTVKQGIIFAGDSAPQKRLRRFVFATVYTKSTAGLLRINCFCEHVLSVCPNERLLKISSIMHCAQRNPILHSLPWTLYGRRQMSHGRICLQ